MESLKQYCIERLHQDDTIISVSAVDNPSLFSEVTDGSDILLLILCQDNKRTPRQFHYIKDDRRIQERWMSPDLDDLILHGEQRNIIYWILKGEVLLDRGTYLETLRHKILEFPFELRDHKLLIEFSKFLRSYMQSKEHILNEHLLDAYNNILKGIHHWARIVIIESGNHPELTVWRQVRTINPGIYKLYEELTLSKETLKQRIQLLLLACEFSLMSMMERCCKPLLDLLKSREEAWSLQDLQQAPKLSDVSVDLPLLLNKLVKKALVKEILHPLEKEISLTEIRYKDAKS